MCPARPATGMEPCAPRRAGPQRRALSHLDPRRLPGTCGDGRPMAKLSMHEQLPFDEATTPPRVSTGELPSPDEVRDVVSEAYERYRANGDGVVADYIPVLA